MIRAWPILAMAASMVLAAVGIFLAGAWHERIIRYDECAYTRIGPQPVYVCPVNDKPLPVRSIPEGDPA